MEVLTTLEKINIIQRQTTYSSEECEIRLLKHNACYISVIKEYMGIIPKPVVIKSVSQEIYKQIRHKLDNSMKVYNDQHPVNVDDVADKLG